MFKNLITVVLVAIMGVGAINLSQPTIQLETTTSWNYYAIWEGLTEAFNDFATWMNSLSQGERQDPTTILGGRRG